MTDIRMIVAWGVGVKLTKDWMSNTIYFSEDNVGTEPDYQSLTDEVAAAYLAAAFTNGSRIEVRTYNMGDASPRPERAFKAVNHVGTYADGPAQVALCLSYYADRNLPRQRGRIYMGPFIQPAARPNAVQQQGGLTLAQALADVGGANVDWSVYSPTKAALGEDATMSITEAWVDNSWDVHRSRKIDATGRVSVAVNE